MSSATLHLTTELGHAGWHDHEVRGVVVFELDPRSTTLIDLALLSLGIRADRDEAHLVLTICAQAALNPDPRIPPMKLVRLGATHGGLLSALAAGLVGIERSLVGMSAVTDSAGFLHDFVARVGWDASDDRIHAALQELKRSGAVIYGFGVPGRPVDERARWMSERLDEVLASPRPWWRMYERIRGCLRLPPNLGAVFAAALLDLGCTPDQIGAISCVVNLFPLLGNAHEGARQAPRLLRTLPAETVSYEGPAPRRSPRAARASKES
ncbi:hypothetical protein [Paraliomyxa miuraensis]|uniref:hypothetical protein n=1 Tax=Paraliomyxa miuraensis TaxID=376150 RepID=UPI002257EB4A|nr:hypothetical protein [Paraliomyxa miuraensis]MCX4243021.1 hypothetical protein [Paraliomyxa miuraensis]